jgi:predicted ATPase
MDRITHVRIKNIRAIESIDLEVSRPFTVLIGENGSCKSTVVECLELLHKAAEQNFMNQFYTQHRGMPGLLRNGATRLELGVVVEDDEGRLPRIDYSFALDRQGAGAVVSSEQILVGPSARSIIDEPLLLLRRTSVKGEVFDEKTSALVPVHSGAINPERLLLTSISNVPHYEIFERLISLFRSIEVHLGFESIAAWAARGYNRPLSIRGSTTLFPAARLDLLGVNLTNAWSELRNRDTVHWERTMDVVRLGLGDQVDTVLIPPDSGGGNVYLAVRFKGLNEPVYASNLSDGQLAWLAFVAMTRLNERRSLLVIDEPDLHMHPYLIGGVITLLKGVGAPVVVTTHSDRMLELLDDPTDSVRVCALEDDGQATLSRLDPTELARWLEHYGDLGQLRAAGYLSRVLRPTSPAPGVEVE